MISNLFLRYWFEYLRNLLERLLERLRFDFFIPDISYNFVIEISDFFENVLMFLWWKIKNFLFSNISVTCRS